jgi:hypothetical protein
MLYRSHTLLSLAAPVLRLARVKPEPARQTQPELHEQQLEPTLDLSSDEHWLRWLRDCFGCETG